MMKEEFMRVAIVGYTGFVGSNLCKEYKFDDLYNSKNISESYGTKPDLLIYSGVPAQKFLANSDPEKDFKCIENAIDNIEKIDPKRLVLISTIDVYKDSRGAKESDEIIEEDLEAYGKNRYYLEKWVMENRPDSLIVHLPALYGDNLKKNFLYDMIHIIPTMIKEGKFLELTADDKYLEAYYEKQDNGFYKYNFKSIEEEAQLKEYFKKIGFTALCFTDSRAVYQFYNLKYLWKHIDIALKNDIKILNLATEPVSSGDIFLHIEGETFTNEISNIPPFYDFRTEYAEVYDGNDGYIFDKEFVLDDIKKFVEDQRNA